MALRVMAAFIDSGGHFTQDIYRECAKRYRAGRKIFAIKGEGGEGKEYVRLMKKDNGKDKSPKFVIGVDSGKEAIMSASGVEEVGPRYMHFPRDYKAGYDMEYFRGLISERMVIHRKMGQAVTAWEKTYERNEPLDCRNYARAAYRYFHWQFDKIEKAQCKASVPDFNIGDTVKVSTKIIEGTTERIQNFTGVVIARKNSGIRETFTVRRFQNGYGVERVFPLHSPRIDHIEVDRRGRVRRAKLYYLRDKIGKGAKVKEMKFNA